MAQPLNKVKYPIAIPIPRGILSIDLSINKLTGLIPAELIQSERLSRINLSFNNITGNIPSEIIDHENFTIYVTQNCLTIDKNNLPLTSALSDKNNTWEIQRTDCSMPYLPPLAEHATSIYNDQTGMLIVKNVYAGGITYYAELKNQGEYQFLLLNSTPLPTPIHEAPATYNFGTLTLELPTVFAFNQLYKVQMKNNGEGLFSLSEVSEY